MTRRGLGAAQPYLRLWEVCQNGGPPENQVFVRSKIMTRKSSTCFGKNGEPLSVYRTEAEAQESARYQKKSGRDLFPRKCERCGEWHLTPLEGKPGDCGCSNSYKNLYPTQEAALRDIERLGAEGRLRPYPCDRGKGWHLTSKMA